MSLSQHPAPVHGRTLLSTADVQFTLLDGLGASVVGGCFLDKTCGSIGAVDDNRFGVEATFRRYLCEKQLVVV